MNAREKNLLKNRHAYRKRINKRLYELLQYSKVYPAVDFDRLTSCIEGMFNLPPDQNIAKWLDKLLELVEHQRGLSPPNLLSLETDTPLHSWLKVQRSRIQKDNTLGLTSEGKLRAQALSMIGYDFVAPPTPTTKTTTKTKTKTKPPTIQPSPRSPAKLSGSPSDNDLPESPPELECESTTDIGSIGNVGTVKTNKLDDSAANEDSSSQTSVNETHPLF